MGKDSSQMPAEPYLLDFGDADNKISMQERSVQMDKERKIRNACEEEYRAIVSEVEKLFATVSANDLKDDVLIEKILKRILAMFQKYEGPLLLEIMQLVRYDDSYYQYHCTNVSLLSAIIGKLALVSEPDLERLIEVGLVMDLGMLLLGENIVSRSRRLTPGEVVRVRQHMLGSARVLKAAGIEDAVVLDAVLNHHERFNGRGYPRGLVGDEIPLLARIISISDSFDAALAHKEYGMQKTLFEVLMEIEGNSSGALDPTLTALTVQGISEMLVGRFVVLSDRSVGKIVKIEPGNYIYPEVIVVGHRVQTGPELYPVSLSSYLPLVYGV